jgi:GNAT superfamily N-acetyltransferase
MKTFKQYFLESKINWDVENRQDTHKTIEYIPNRNLELNKELKTQTHENKKKEISDQIEWNNLSLKYANDGITIDPTIHSINGEVKPNRIYIPKNMRGHGIGSKLMKDIIDLADKQNRKIVLTPDIKLGATSVSRLKKFYKKFGFVENKGRYKDFSISDTMYRLPNKL